MNALYLGYHATAVLNSLQPCAHEGEKHGPVLFSAMRRGWIVRMERSKRGEERTRLLRVADSPS